MRSLLRLVIVGCAVCAGAAAIADSEAGNHPAVFASKTGLIYARTVPLNSLGTAGVTRVFRVQRSGDDKLLYEYPWYADYLTIRHVGGNVFMVRFGGWSQGGEASDEDLALEFYHNGELRASYSTLDFAKTRNNVACTVSHYTWSKGFVGFRRRYTPDQRAELLFEVRNLTGELFVIDPKTGAIRAPETIGEPLDSR